MGFYRKSILTVLLIFFANSFIFADEMDKFSEKMVKSIFLSVSKEKTVVLMPFKVDSGQTAFANMLSNKIVDKILKSGVCIPLERDYVENILAELKLQYSGATDQKNAIKIGSLTGAQLMLAGSINKIGDKKQSINARLFSIETGEIISSFTGEFKWENDLKKDSVSEYKLIKDTVSIESKKGENCEWIKSSFLKELNEDYKVDRVIAIMSARRKAEESVFGGKTLWRSPQYIPDYSDLDYENMINSSRDFAIDDEKIVEEKKEDNKLSIILETCVKHLRPNTDKDFKVQLLMSKGVFLEGEFARFSVSVSSAAMVYVYNISKDGVAQLIYPRQGVFSETLPEKPIIFPSDEDILSGTVLKALLPQGVEYSLESLRAFAVKTSDKHMLDGVHSYQDIVSVLEKARVDWSEESQFFLIKKKK